MTRAAASSAWPWLMAAWLLALAATLAALFIGEVMGMTPCTLCWYQRILMFPLALILGIAAFRGDPAGALYALPLALGGVAMAGYHTALVAGWVPVWWVPCGAGPSCSDQPLVIFGNIQIPWLALAAFVAISACLLIVLRHRRLP